MRMPPNTIKQNRQAAELRDRAEIGWALALAMGRTSPPDAGSTEGGNAGAVLGSLRAACLVAILDPGHTAEEKISAVTLCLNAAFQAGRGNYGGTAVVEPVETD